MSDKLNTYSFLPWVREGIANQIENSVDNTDKLRASIKFNFGIKGGGIGDDKVSTPLMSKTVSLYGPGDVIGIDARNIIKTEPHNWITNFEPNYLPCIDFYDEDFPWRYSPAQPQSGKLMPWLALVVLEEDQFEPGNDITNKPLPYFKLLEDTASKVFQPSDQLWAWAHVHVNTDLITGESDGEVEDVFEDNEVKMSDIVEAYNDLLKANPDNAYSRIMCPIKLKPNAAYHAFLIPSFESGRLVGLGKDVDAIFEGDSYEPKTPAWGKQGDTEFREDADTFPIYHQWYFRTGNAGDFEYLVRLLDPQPIDARVGTRNMDVTDPGYGITGVLDSEEAPEGETTPELGDVLRLGGALMIPEKYRDNPELYELYENWDQPYPRKFQKELAAFINLADDFNQKNTKKAYDNEDLPSDLNINEDLPSDLHIIDKDVDDPDPLITPPLYGRWHSLSKRLLTDDPENPKDNWVHQINLDPRHRATAGFGTKIVQKNQDTYMEAAWDQVGDILEANRRIREAQMAKVVAKCWYFKYLEPLRISNPEAYIGITQPLHRRLVSEVSTQSAQKQFYTVHHQISMSKVPGIVLSPGIRTFSRPGSRLSKKLGFDPKLNPAEKLVGKINNGEIIPAPPKKIPEGVSSIKKFREASRPTRVAGFLLRWAEKYKWLKLVFLGISLVLLALLIIFVGPNLSNITLGIGSLSGAGLLFAILFFYLFLLFSKWENQISLIPGLSEENQTRNAIDNLPIKPDFKLTVAGDAISFKTGEEDSKEGERFKQGLADVAEILQANIAAAAINERPPLETDNIVQATSATINPNFSIPRYILRSQVNIPSRLVKERGPEVFKEAMAYPELDFPMYKPLADISADLFLPNINYVAQNSISLLETNQEFIEAYLVGLNHEFARELLWREYPTDQRGTYFRQFWDVSDFQFDPVDDEKFKKLAREEIAKEKPDEEATDDEINEKVEDLKRESLMDITRLHKWNRRPSRNDAEAHLLGTHDNRKQYRKEKLENLYKNQEVDEEEGEGEGEGEENEKDKKEVVLVIRGELLKKYPNTVIYAHKAQWQPTEEDGIIPDPSVERILKDLPGDPELFTRDDIKTPIFEAQVEPDIYFFGFDLTTDVAVGRTDGNPVTLDDNPGWFFVIKERPGEPRFGLDIGDGNSAIEVWNDMSWGALDPPINEEVSGQNFIRLPKDDFELKVVKTEEEIAEDNRAEKEEQWGEDEQLTWYKEMNSSEIAYILYQAPVMMAIHALEMLPKKSK